MTHNVLSRQLKRLLIGMADQKILSGHEFLYDGGKLDSNEVGDLAFPSVLCIAQDLSERLGLESFGYRFSLNAEESVGFPLTMTCISNDKYFFEIAPFVVEVFYGEVMDCSADLAKLFESAARLIDHNFSLVLNTNYSEFDHR